MNRGVVYQTHRTVYQRLCDQRYREPKWVTTIKNFLKVWLEIDLELAVFNFFSFNRILVVAAHVYMLVFVKLDSQVKVIVASVALDCVEQTPAQVFQALSGSIQSFWRGENCTPTVSNWNNENFNCVPKKHLIRLRRFTNKQSCQCK